MRSVGLFPLSMDSIGDALVRTGDNAILQSIFDGFPDSIVVIDRSYKVIMANKAFENLLGKNPDEIANQLCFHVCHNTSSVCGDCQAENVFLNMNPPSRIRKCAMGGEHRQFEIFNFPIRNRDGEVLYMIEYIKDITEKQIMEKELMERRRLAIIGEMAAKTSHEIRNPLNAMEGAAHYLMEEYGSEQKIQKYLGLIREQISRLNDVTTNLLNRAKPKIKNREKEYISGVLVRSIEIAQYLINGKDIDIDLLIDETLPPIKFNHTEMQEVFVNVLRNAIDAIPEKGKIEIVGQVRQRKGEDFVEVSIIDNGIGILPENRERVFDSFYTTKEHGTGLGLPIVSDIMKTHGGYIFVEGGAGGGTSVVLGIPLE